MNKNETLADVVTEMHRTKYGDEDCPVKWCLSRWADRIEAATKREAKASGNAAKLREALKNCANMGEQIDCQLGSSDATVYAFRHERCLARNISECARAALAAPPRRSGKERLMEANNSMAMREALEAARPILANCVFTHYNTVSVDEVVRLVDAALSAPPRNCDVGTAEEQAKRFSRFCQADVLDVCSKSCPLYNHSRSRDDCAIQWEQMPYAEGVAE